MQNHKSVYTESSINPKNIKAICFDLGNTLVEFGSNQITHINRALENLLTELFGSCDHGKLKTIRDRQITAPYNNGYRENDLADISKYMIREMYNTDPQDHHVEHILNTRYQSFVQVVEVPEGVKPLLQRLGLRYHLGLLSNYPCGRSVRASLEKTGLSELFDSITVSGEVGYVKPHKRPFEAMLSKLGLNPEDCVYVGDNWLADVQGAKRLGMSSVHTTQYIPYPCELFQPAEGDHIPDVHIHHINELEALFLGEV